MHTKTISGQSGARQDIVHLSILLAVGLAIGIYLICTAVVIAKDGVTFIEYARNLQTAPTETMIEEAQHPGYPFLILTAHRIVEIVHNGSSLWTWLYSAQGAALTFRLLGIAAIYGLGRVLVGPGQSFLATLIFVFLPGPAEYGSDALSDWPALFFLITGLLLSIRGAAARKWWLFGLAGVSAGAGYLIRPECAQLIVYAFLWLALQLFRPKHIMTRPRLLLALAALLVGFCVLATPYMRLKGAVFPKKGIGGSVSNVHAGGCQSDPQTTSNAIYAHFAGRSLYVADIASLGVVEGAIKLFGNIGDTMMWFFVPPMFIGLWDFLKRRAWLEPKQFFVIVPIILNVALMLWLHAKYGYMSNRHTLPLVVFCVLYVPLGLQISASWLCGRTGPIIRQCGPCRLGGRTPDSCKNFLFSLLLVMGICVCIPKLLRPLLHHDKQSLRKTALWLAENTGQADVIAVPDFRISFYSGRKAVLFDGVTIPQEARYVVDVLKEGRSVSPQGVREAIDKGALRAEKSIDDDSGNLRIIIYRRVD